MTGGERVQLQHRKALWNALCEADRREVGLVFCTQYIPHPSDAETIRVAFCAYFVTSPDKAPARAQRTGRYYPPDEIPTHIAEEWKLSVEHDDEKAGDHG